MTEEFLSSLLEDMTNDQAFNHIEKYKGLKVRLQAEAIHEEWQKEERL